MFLSIFVQPLYNCFIFILGIVPGADVGIGIIVLTILVRAVFYPLFTASIRTQMAMQAVQPELAEINEKYKNDTLERGRRTTEVFQRHKVKPFTTIFASLVQIVIFISLSYAFFRLGLPHIRTDLLYSFVRPFAPAAANETFLGFFNLLTPNHLVLTALVVVLQYLVMHLTLARTTPASTAHLSKEQAAAQQMQRHMMQYLLPGFIGVATYFTAGAVGLYFLISNLISLGQEWILRRRPL